MKYASERPRLGTGAGMLIAEEDKRECRWHDWRPGDQVRLEWSVERAVVVPDPATPVPNPLGE